MKEVIMCGGLDTRLGEETEFTCNQMVHKGKMQDGSKFVPECTEVYQHNVSKMDTIPIISVIIPCFNYGQYLKEAVESVVKQTYKNFEIIIVNDGSTDNTKEISEGLISQYSSYKIRLLNQENSGHPAISRNRGISEAQGKYILPLDADDVIATTMLEECVNLLEEKPDISIAYTDQIYFGMEVSQLVLTFEYDFAQLANSNFIGSCSMYRKKAWEDTGGYKIIGYEDWEFWISCGERGHIGKRIAKPLFHYRKHRSGTYAKDLKRDQFLKAQIILNHPNLYNTDVVISAKAFLNMPEENSTTKDKINIVAIIAAYNEGDVIYHAIEDLIRQGIEVYLIDNCSTDNTVEEASKWLGKGLLHVERFPDDYSYPEACRKEYIWKAILRRKEEIAARLDCDWYIHSDADEFRESPWEGLSLKEAIHVVDSMGYNAIDFELFNFRPTNNNFIPGTDVRHTLLYYEGSEDFNYLQIKAWKGQSVPVQIADSGGHNISFPGRKVFPVKFILRHYPIRSQYHGTQKVFEDRKRRFNKDEKSMGWHIQYDTILDTKHNFLHDELKLKLYDPYFVRVQILSAQVKEIVKKLSCEDARHAERLGKGPGDEYLTAQQLAADGDADGAISVLLKLLDVHPVTATFHNDLGVLYYSKGDKEKAQFHYEKALTLAPDDIIFQKNLADLYFVDLGRIEDAMLIYLKILSTHPEDVETLLALGHVCSSLGTVNDAGFFYNKVLEADPLNKGAAEGLKKLSEAVVYGLANTKTETDTLQIRQSMQFEREEEGEGIRSLSVSIVIPIFNQLHFTKQCVEGILKHTRCKYELIFVDNASSDGTSDWLRQITAENNNFRMITNRENQGFAKACNQGALVAFGKYLVFLNNDTFPHEKWLDALVSTAEADDAIGILGSKLLYPNGSIQHAGVVVGLKDGETYPYHIYLCKPADAPYANKVREFQMVTGACLFIRRNILDRIGAFDETYINGHEDLDLCLRVRATGYKVVYCPQSVLTHFEAQTKRLVGLENFHYKKGVDNEEGRGRQKFLSKWKEKIEIDDRRYYEEDGFLSQVSESANRLKILFTMYGWNETGGGTIFPKALAQELVKRDCRVSVFYASLKNDSASEAYAVSREVDDGVILYGIYNRPAVFIDPDNPEREIHDEGVLKRFREVLDEEKPDVVHFHNFHGLTFAMAEETKRRSIPACYTPHNYHMIDPQLYLFNSDLSLWTDTNPISNSEAVNRNHSKAAGYEERIRITKKLLNEWVDVTLAVSERQRELLIQYGADSKRISVVHQANRTADALWGNERLAQEGKRQLHSPLRVGFIGGVMPHKGVHMLVAAVQHLNSSEIECQVYGFISPQYLEQLQALDKKKIVKFRGEYRLEDLETIAHEMDVAVVPSLWEDCAPLVLLELNSMRMPVIAARIGGIPDFVMEGSTGFLYKYDSLNELVSKLRYCIDNPKIITDMRTSLRQMHSFERYVVYMEGLYGALRTGDKEALRDTRLTIDVQNEKTKDGKIAVIWEGSQFVYHSLALINRELSIRLAQDPKVDLSIIPYEKHQFGIEVDERYKLIEHNIGRSINRPVDVHVRHQWPPNFTPPPSGHWVMIQPWEFGSLPEAWIHPMSTMVDEMWVPSSFVRECYLKSGIPADRVFVVSNGVDSSIFNPNAQPLKLRTKKKFKFLFVGGTISRKGIDILLDAYAGTFSRNDDVCLVIKDMGGKTFYKGQTAEQLIEMLRSRPDAPEIEYIEHMLNDKELSGLYTACDCLVHPYRGEGFGLPIAEAMASGLPVIVTGYGAALDFCSADNAYLLPSQQVLFSEKKVGNLETVDYPWLAEPDRDFLKKIMKHVFEHPDEAKVKGNNARIQIQTNFTWERAAEAAIHRLNALSLKPILRFDKTMTQISENSSNKDIIQKSFIPGLTSVVVHSLSNLKKLRQCKQELEKHTPEQYEIIFVDCNSPVEITKWLKKQPDVTKHNNKLIEARSGQSFVQVLNQGISASSGEFIVLLSSDVMVSEYWLTDMIECLHSAGSIGIIGPLADTASCVQGSGVVNNKSQDELISFRERNRHRRIDARTLDGFCMLFRQHVFLEIGLFDETFISDKYVFDDFCLRAIIAGYRNVVAADVLIRNYGLSMSGNKKIFDEKWTGIALDTTLGKKVAAINHIDKADKLSQSGNLDKAIGMLIEGIKYAPNEKAIYYRLAEMLLDEKLYKDALEAIKSMPPEAKDDLKRLELIAYCTEELDDAGRYADRLLEIDKGYAPAWNLKGTIAFKQGDNAAADGFFRRAIEADPGYGAPYTNRGMLKWESDKKEEALDLLEKGFILSPTATDSVTLYHSAITALEQFKRAEKIFQDAKELYPENKRVLFFLIDILLKQGKLEIAMHEVERAMLDIGIDDGMLSAALAIREKVGIKEINKTVKNKGTLSLCMIVKNEEKHLARCLLSAGPVVDEIIIVDTGSTDRTMDIARAYGAKVLEFTWTNDFSEARNYSLSNAVGDWILVLDADEVIAPQDYAGFEKIVKSRASRSAAYTMVTRNYTNEVTTKGWTANDRKYLSEEAGTGWFPSAKVRLFVNDKRIQFQNPVHEFVEGSLEKAGIEIKISAIPVHHYGRFDKDKLIEKGKKYFLLGKKKIEEMKGDYKALKELAIQACELGEYETAVELWKEAIKLNQIEPDAFLNIGYAYLKLEKYQEALDSSRRAMELAPSMKEAVLNYANAEFLIGDIGETISVLEELLQKHPEYPSAMLLISAAYYVQGQKEKGLGLFEKLRKKGFNWANFLDEQSQALILLGKFDQAILLLEAAVKTGNINKDTDKLIVECQGKIDGHAIGHAAFDQVEA